MTRPRAVTQLDLLTETVEKLVTILQSVSPLKTQQAKQGKGDKRFSVRDLSGNEIVFNLELKNEDISSITNLLHAIARSQLEGLKALEKNKSIAAEEEMIPYFREAICRNLTPEVLQILKENLVGILNSISTVGSKSVTEDQKNLIQNAYSAVSEAILMQDSKYLEKYAAQLKQDEEKINPILDVLKKMDKDKVCDISFTEKKDKQITQFILVVLGKQPEESKGSTKKDYSKKKSVKNLLAYVDKIGELQESDEVKFHLKIFALMVTMGNTSQIKRDNSIISTLVKFGHTIHLPLSQPSISTLRSKINRQLDDLLLMGEFIDQSVANEAISKNMPKHAVANMTMAYHKAFLHEALVEIVDKLRAACQSGPSESLYSEMMLKFMKVKDETFKNSILIRLTGREEEKFSPPMR